MSPAKTHLDVIIVTPDGILFQGKADTIIFPGEKGVFEVLPHHKPLMSRLLRGDVLIDSRSIPIERGVVKVGLNTITAIVETNRS